MSDLVNGSMTSMTTADAAVPRRNAQNMSRSIIVATSRHSVMMSSNSWSARCRSRHSVRWRVIRSSWTVPRPGLLVCRLVAFSTMLSRTVSGRYPPSAGDVDLLSALTELADRARQNWLWPAFLGRHRLTAGCRIPSAGAMRKKICRIQLGTHRRREGPAWCSCSINTVSMMDSDVRVIVTIR